MRNNAQRYKNTSMTMWGFPKFFSYAKEYLHRLKSRAVLLFMKLRAAHVDMSIFVTRLRDGC